MLSRVLPSDQVGITFPVNGRYVSCHAPTAQASSMFYILLSTATYLLKIFRVLSPKKLVNNTQPQPLITELGSSPHLWEKALVSIILMTPGYTAPTSILSNIINPISGLKDV